MGRIFKLDDIELISYVEATREFYRTQSRIIDDCECEDCKFYYHIFSRKNLELYNYLSNLGVDIRKNLDSEPTGVWCCRDENEDLIFCEHNYQVIGELRANTENEFIYIKNELGYVVKAYFEQLEQNIISVQLSIKQIENA